MRFNRACLMRNCGLEGVSLSFPHYSQSETFNVHLVAMPPQGIQETQTPYCQNPLNPQPPHRSIF